MKKLFKVLTFILCAVMLCGLAACGGGKNTDGGGKNTDNNTDPGGDGNTPGGVQTYGMEAEYIDLDGVQGAGISSEAYGVSMIYGDGDQEDKDKGWSNGYYVGFTYAADLTLNFKFNAAAAGTATVMLRLGSELGNITLTPDNFAVKVNGAAVAYTNIFISNSSSMEVMAFSDKTVAANAQLVAGENTISLVVLQNTLKNNSSTGGPTIDCIKIKTSSVLTWTDKTENISAIGEI
jgi:hypothetical protein